MMLLSLCRSSVRLTLLLLLSTIIPSSLSQSSASSSSSSSSSAASSSSLSITCSTDEDCQDALLSLPGSQCIDNRCTNPFYNGGCLANMLPKRKAPNQKKWHNIRVCTSDDPPEAQELGHCRMTELIADNTYMEVRILTLGWESAIFQAWILQILLSEILNVPVTLETGVAGTTADFYDQYATTLDDYGRYQPDFQELQVSADILDCRLVKEDNGNNNNKNEAESGGQEDESGEEQDPEDEDSAQEVSYQPCGHYVPEVWEADTLVGLIAEGAGPFRDLGVLGTQHWYVPRFTADRHPSLISYFGLRGEENRRTLAETFQRPTTWKDYCDQVSIDHCATPNKVAARAPRDGENGDSNGNENDMYFAQDLYTGHFRFTDANNCTANPDTCTGHFADYPCGWETFSPQQLYHLDIALKSDGADASGGYTSAQLIEIWKAANATKSDVMMMWWTPEALYQNFLGTDAEFVPVVLPPQTQECKDARVRRGSLCEEDFDVATMSDPNGACDYGPSPIKRLIGDGLYEATFGDPTIPEALQSPAYEMIENFGLTNLALGEIFKYANELDSPIDPTFDPRHATCRWVVENFDLVSSFIPDSHPRTVNQEEPARLSLFVGAMTFACIIACIVGYTLIEVHQRKNTKVMFYAQIEFLTCLLMGLLLLCFGAIVLTAVPSDITCQSSLWLINVGYALQFAPLIVRVFAINRLANRGKLMQRLRLNQFRLFGFVFLVLLLVCGFCLAWTLLDPPEPAFYYQITDTKTETGETIVLGSDFCQSDSNVWQSITFAWQGALLLPGAIIAFISTSNTREDVNDTTALSRVLYSHVFFFFFRATLYLLRDYAELSDLMAHQSLLISSDVFVTVALFIFPKFINKREMDNEILPDIFLKTTVLAADVRGFTAWSSAREPVQVFKLLETLYEVFDNIADKHNVYKVETVRDCYVAATGIPDPQPQHAQIMAKFAIELLKKMDHITKKLELMFGPDTGDLTLRIGIHSGPVTGGFLKRKGARFQLFGDTMTTASLIQLTGESNRVHLSRATADLLIQAGHEGWITKRADMVATEQKGELETWWLTRGIKDIGNFDDGYPASSVAYTASVDHSNDDANDDIYDSEKRWIEWNVDMLASVLRQIVAKRATRSSIYMKPSDTQFKASSTMPLEEVAEIIELPKFDKRAAKRQRSGSVIDMDGDVMFQLKLYVTQVAGMYNDNPFHNFAHASYVVMAVSKYMNRIVAASEVDLGYEDAERLRGSTHEALHDHTYGITSDPLTRFACIFSALIHDIDHPGVPNPQLIKEDGRLAGMYNNRSVAEQNSFDLAWDLLMDDSFSLLRTTICADDSELRRFRQLVVNSVMATDLGDKELKELRNGRWYKAFDDESDSAQEEDSRDALNRKATIVIEHIIQAADIAHTCQHWGIYRKWNERLFEECYRAYRDGRADKNPADGWYQGELGFYDFYIIPLAKKLRDCGVFGPTSGENLDYATNNRAKWERDGETIVANMLEKIEREYCKKEEETAPTVGIEGLSMDFDDYETALRDVNTLM